jgi:nicotinic acid mononucleotide adenylyltransferase
MDVSATAIRRLASEGRSREVAGLVPPPVADFIDKYKLYRKG